jgi:hypothetical protein
LLKVAIFYFSLHRSPSRQGIEPLINLCTQQYNRKYVLMQVHGECMGTSWEIGRMYIRTTPSWLPTAGNQAKMVAQQLFQKMKRVTKLEDGDEKADSGDRHS